MAYGKVSFAYLNVLLIYFSYGKICGDVFRMGRQIEQG